MKVRSECVCDARTVTVVWKPAWVGDLQAGKVSFEAS